MFPNPTRCQHCPHPQPTTITAVTAHTAARTAVALEVLDAARDPMLVLLPVPFEKQVPQRLQFKTWVDDFGGVSSASKQVGIEPRLQAATRDPGRRGPCTPHNVGSVGEQAGERRRGQLPTLAASRHARGSGKARRQAGTGMAGRYGHGQT